MQKSQKISQMKFPEESGEILKGTLEGISDGIQSMVESLKETMGKFLEKFFDATLQKYL